MMESTRCLTERFIDPIDDLDRYSYVEPKTIPKVITYPARFIRDRLLALAYMIRPPENPVVERYGYQKQFIKHQFKDGEKVLDVGSGGAPFPYATVLVDKYPGITPHRHDPFKSNGLPLHICDICDMPFKDKEFDYVVASHVLEHVNDPQAACRELIRVGKAGYIESPNFMKDSLFAWARGMHKWHLIAHEGTLFFCEYTDRQLDGIRSLEWQKLMFSTMYHPMQSVFNRNQDIFNTMFEWKGGFNVVVLRNGVFGGGWL